MFLNPFNSLQLQKIRFNFSNTCSLCLSKVDPSELSPLDAKIRAALKILDIKIKNDDEGKICEKCVVSINATPQLKESPEAAKNSETSDSDSSCESKKFDRPKRQCSRPLTYKDEPEEFNETKPIRKKGRYTGCQEICIYCKKFYSNPYTLKRHMQLLHGWKGYKCDFCFETFTTPRSLKSHTALTHEVYKCVRCSKSYHGKKFLDAHGETCRIEPDKELENPQCGPKKLNGVYYCCSKSFTNVHAFRQHRYNHHGDPIDKRIKFSRVHHDEDFLAPKQSSVSTKVICKMCGNRFKGKQELFEHLTNDHKKIVGVYPKRCDLCGISFSSPQMAKEHKEQSHEN